MIKQFYFKQFILAKVIFALSFNIKAQRLNVKQFNVSQRWDPIRCYLSGSVMTMKEYFVFPKSPA